MVEVTRKLVEDPRSKVRVNCLVTVLVCFWESTSDVEFWKFL